MFNPDKAVKLATTIGTIADNSRELLDYLDEVAKDTDIAGVVRAEIESQTKVIDDALIKIVLELTVGLKGE